ncbi:ribonuclease H-like protein [Pyrenochaeta sp. DS3sAY3a]|nr:ribonuclease H-like protein [Pyrenochaeta sp. DS3sAY3a]
MSGREPLIINRKFTPCPSTADWSVPQLVRECPDCSKYMMHCCACTDNNNHSSARRGLPPPKEPCHHFRVVFIDGACTNNGHPEAKAGMGFAYGADDAQQKAVPITEMVDKSPVRSNQRAELLAAVIGVQLCTRFLEMRSQDHGGDEDKVWIIATDSEYVVKGITEWLPTWKSNNWRTSKGTTPANLDLFCALDRLVTKHETKDGTIGFWHVPREHNKVADRLAKEAAVDGTEATTEAQVAKH